MSTASAAERMNRIYRRQRHIYDATRSHYLLGRTAFIDELTPPPTGHVLEIGCGTGWNLIRAAAKYPRATFYGLDISSAMLDTAQRSIARHGLAHRIVLGETDATAFDPLALFGRATFDRVFVCYALSMIPDWPQVIARAAGALGNNGVMHVLDFGDCRGLPRAFKRLLYAWLKHFSVRPIPDFEGRMDEAAARLRLASKTSHPYRGYVARAVLSRGC